MFPERLNRNSKYLFRLKEIFSSEKYDLAHVFLKTNYSRDMHMQEYFEINIVSRGAGVHYVGDERHYVTAGDVFVIPPGVAHGYYEFDNLDVHHIVLNAGFLEKYLHELCEYAAFGKLFDQKTYASLTLNTTQHAEISAILDSAMKYKNRTSSEENLYLASAALCVIKLLCLTYTKSKRTDKGEVKEKSVIFSALMKIKTSYSEDLTIEKLAKEANLSRSSFIRRFKETCQTSPAAYIMSVRIEAAKALLSDREISVADVAARCGFYDAAHFSKKFKEKTGYTPLDYRKKYAAKV